MLITGGYDTEQSAEIYHPDLDSPCVLQDLPDWRRRHTQDGSLLCGGGRWDTHRSCRRWNPDTGAWDLVTEELTEKRLDHISWTLADGSVTYLMGGLWSGTTEILEHDNSRDSTSFPLKHFTR